MLVSVVMPLYNHQAYVSEAITSVLHQSYKNWELIICDDGSTDDSANIIRNFSNLDDRIKIISKRNGGTVSALNCAIAESKGEIICWLSSDDLYHPEKIQTHVTLHSQMQVPSIVGCGGLADGHLFAYPRIQPDASDMMLRFLFGNYINGLAIAIPRKIYIESGLFDARYPYAHDVECWMRIIKDSEINFSMEEPLSFSRTHNEQTSPNLGIIDVLHAQMNWLLKEGFGFYKITSSNEKKDLIDFSLKSALYAMSPGNIFSHFGLSNILVGYYYEYIEKQNIFGEITEILNSSNFDKSKISIQLLSKINEKFYDSYNYKISFAEILPIIQRQYNNYDKLSRTRFDFL